MKKLLLSCALMIIFISAYAQNDYSRGFQSGYKEGYCYNDFGCISPVPPVTPVPLIGESNDSFQDGYNRGFKMGLENKASKRTSNSNSRTGSSHIDAQPAQDNYINTYVSPDWDLLIRAAQSKQEYERQVALSKMKQTVNQYLSFSNFPERIQNGWHNAVIMDNFNFCDERKVYVDNNRITKYVIDNYAERGVTFSGNIDKGRGIIKIKYPNNEESGYLDVFFIESIASPGSSSSAPQETGKISFWTDWKRANTMVLYMEGDYVGPFKSYFENGIPQCGQEGTLTITYKPGTYNYRVEGESAFGTVNWEGKVTIYPGQCQLQKLSKR
jgi:hypothetical protein